MTNVIEWISTQYMWIAGVIGIGGGGTAGSYYLGKGVKDKKQDRRIKALEDAQIEQADKLKEFEKALALNTLADSNVSKAIEKLERVVEDFKKEIKDDIRDLNNRIFNTKR